MAEAMRVKKELKFARDMQALNAVIAYENARNSSRRRVLDGIRPVDDDLGRRLHEALDPARLGDDDASYNQALHDALHRYYGDTADELLKQLPSFRQPIRLNATDGFVSRFAGMDGQMDGVDASVLSGAFADGNTMIAPVHRDSPDMSFAIGNIAGYREYLDSGYAAVAYNAGLTDRPNDVAVMNVFAARATSRWAELNHVQPQGVNPALLNSLDQPVSVEDMVSASKPLSAGIDVTMAEANAAFQQNQAQSQPQQAQVSAAQPRDLTFGASDDVERNRLYREYIFARAILDHNAGSERSGEGLITCSVARELRSKLSPDGFYQVTPALTTGAFIQQINEQAAAMGLSLDIDEPQLAEYKNEYGAMTGFANTRSVSRDVNHMLPVSPYDPRFSMNGSMLSGASSIGFVPMSALKRDEGWSREFNDIRASRSLPVVHLRNRFDFDASHVAAVMQNDPNGARRLTDDLDVVGLSALRPYMSADEFKALSPALYNAVNVNQLSDEDIAAYRDAARQSAYLLKGLSERGYNYSVSADMNDGQIKAQLTDDVMSDVQVRVWEPNLASRRYIGRVTRQGVTTYLGSTYNAQGSRLVLDEPHWDYMFTLIDHAVGRSTLDPTGTYERRTYSKQTHQTTITTHNASYYNESNHMQMTALGPDDVTDGGRFAQYGHQLVAFTSTSHARTTSTDLDTPSAAETFLIQSIDSARRNVGEQLDVERIISAADDYLMSGGDEQYMPLLSSDDDIAAVQQSWFNVLTGKASTLVVPGAAADHATEAMLDGEDSDLQNYTFSGDADTDWPKMVRNHAKLVVDSMVGTLNADDNLLHDGLSFDPVALSVWSSTSRSQYAVMSDVSQAIKTVGIDVNTLRGDEESLAYIADKMVSFDASSARAFEGGEFMDHMRDTLETALKSQGMTLNGTPMIDANGIVEYHATMHTSANPKADGSDTKEITGHIGQIFEPDDMGVVRTRFASSANAAYIYGYDASLEYAPGDTRPMEERLRLRGFEQRMADSIRAVVREQALGTGDTRENATSLNATYRKGYGYKRPLDFVQRMQDNGFEPDEVRLIVDTMRSRVHMSREIIDGSNFARAAQLETAHWDKADDNHMDAYIKTGQRDISVIPREVSGYFDPTFTTATSTDQGGILYLCESAKVAQDGHIIKGEDGDLCRMHKSDWFRYAGHSPFDREAMTLSNLMSASSVTKPVGVAQMTISGYGFDDGLVVSKRFAETHMVRNANDELRGLIKQDKLSDLYGNKGVISEIIDTDLSESDAIEKGPMYFEAWQYFKANPDMDVVMSPYSAVSRFNAGTALEMMEHPANLNMPNGESVEGGLGHLRFIVTDKAADVKTHAYDESAVKAGKGRKVSAQAAWALASKGADEIGREVYSANDHVIRDLREQLITLGMDISPDGKLLDHYDAQGSSTRRIIDIPDVDQMITTSMRKVGKEANSPEYESYSISRKGVAEQWSARITRSGGFMRVPFDLVAKVGDDKLELPKDPATGDTLMPVMSARLRSNRRFADGTIERNDATVAYENIFKSAVKMAAAPRIIERARRLAAAPGIDSRVKDHYEREIAKQERILKEEPQVAQRAYDSVTAKVSTRLLSGKRNMAREDLMSRRMPNSATAVWSADPSLDIDQIAVSPALAKTLDAKDDDYVLVWRDPVLRDSGVRYMRVKIDESISGAAITPVMDKGFDGDFDGDTVALVTLHDKAAQAQAKELFSVEANLLDREHVNDDGTYDLNMHGASLDLASLNAAQKAAGVPENETFAAKFEALRLAANKAYDTNGKPDLDRCRKIMGQLSELYKDSFEGSAGNSVLRFSDKETYLNSLVDACVKTGAKGSMSKIENGFMPYAGFTCDFDDNGHVQGQVKDSASVPGYDAISGVMVATAVKSFGTGIAGRFSQFGMMACRNTCPTAVLEVTHPITQSTLQSKHDPEEARRKFELMRGPLKSLWSGYSIEKDESSGEWKTSRSKDGGMIRLSAQEWVNQMRAIYTDKEHGLNVDVNEFYLMDVADALEGEDGYIRDVRDTQTAIEASSPLDQMAYADQKQMMSTFVKAAHSGADLFAGKNVDMLTPRTVRRNRVAAAHGEAMEPLECADTLEGGLTKRAAAKLAAGASYDVAALPRWVREAHGLSFTTEGLSGDKAAVMMDMDTAQVKASGVLREAAAQAYERPAQLAG